MYLPRMSVSIFTLSPFDLWPNVVTLRVLGISDTDTRSFLTSTKVRLTPSTAIEPFGTTDFKSASSSLKSVVRSEEHTSELQSHSDLHFSLHDALPISVVLDIYQGEADAVHCYRALWHHRFQERVVQPEIGG